MRMGEPGLPTRAEMARRIIERDIARQKLYRLAGDRQRRVLELPADGIFEKGKGLEPAWHREISLSHDQPRLRKYWSTATVAMATPQLDRPRPKYL